MNENLNLVEILKDVPEGTKLYSTVFGVVTFDSIDEDEEYPIMVFDADGYTQTFTKEGYEYEKQYPGAECVLFPSKDQRDWSKFKVEKKKVVELRPFYLVLVRDNNDDYWRPRHFSHFTDDDKYRFACTDNDAYDQCIPYDLDTEKLALTRSNPGVEYELTGRFAEGE